MYETYIYALLPDIVFVGKPVLTVHSLSHQETPLSRAFLPAMAYQSWDDSLENWATPTCFIYRAAMNGYSDSQGY